MKPRINFGPNANPHAVCEYALGVLGDALITAGIESATISSTSRDSGAQARVMFENLEANGPGQQHKLYGPNGDKVIDVYEALKAQKKGRSEIIAAMKAKIDELGPGNVSHHCADPNKLCVFDVGPSSIPASKMAAFEAAVRADKRVSKFFTPPLDPGLHLEVPIPS